ncbi:MAG: hypothetical protein H6630_08980, partial [Arcobacter sp.]|nr:hypothetical protein [Arcobacter sp.]
EKIINETKPKKEQEINITSDNEADEAELQLNFDEFEPEGKKSFTKKTKKTLENFKKVEKIRIDFM